MRNSLKLAAVLIAATAATASAQTGGRNSNGVPPGQRPAAGMCRVWVTGVAPGRQSAATDCATAEAQARLTANSRVIYGGKPGSKGKNDDGLLTRRRQLADGSWVVDRYRRDAAGNLTVVSTKPWKGEKKIAKRELKAHQKAEDQALKSRRDELDHSAMKDAREDLKAHQKLEKRELKDRFDNGDDKGKGKSKGKN